MEKLKKFLFVVLLICFIDVIPVEAKEYKLKDVANKDVILLPGDVVIYPEDGRWAGEYGELWLYGGDISTPLLRVDGKEYKIGNSWSSIGDLFYVNSESVILPSLDTILSGNFEDQDFYLDAYYILNEAEKSALIERIKHSFNISYQINVRFNASAEYGVYCNLLFDYLPIKISYKNTLGCDNENPVKYYYEDGVIKLIPLEKAGYVFEGWYKDSEYKFRIDELTPDNMSTDLVLYAKWSKLEDNEIVNPETFTPMIIVSGIVFLVIVITFGVYFYKKR